MQLVMAVVRPAKLDDVRLALSKLGIGGMTISEVLCCCRHHGHARPNRAMAQKGGFTPKIKIEVAVDDVLLDQVVETLKKTARTGEIGDGKIFTAEIGRAMRIRTGEVDRNAI